MHYIRHIIFVSEFVVSLPPTNAGDNENEERIREGRRQLFDPYDLNSRKNKQEEEKTGIKEL